MLWIQDTDLTGCGPSSHWKETCWLVVWPHYKQCQQVITLDSSFSLMLLYWQEASFSLINIKQAAFYLASEWHALAHTPEWHALASCRASPCQAPLHSFDIVRKKPTHRRSLFTCCAAEPTFTALLFVNFDIQRLWILWIVKLRCEPNSKLYLRSTLSFEYSPME